jgi:hypothetical protein
MSRIGGSHLYVVSIKNGGWTSKSMADSDQKVLPSETANIVLLRHGV